MIRINPEENGTPKNEFNINYNYQKNCFDIETTLTLQDINKIKELTALHLNNEKRATDGNIKKLLKQLAAEQKKAETIKKILEQ